MRPILLFSQPPRMLALIADMILQSPAYNKHKNEVGARDLADMILQILNKIDFI